MAYSKGDLDPIPALYFICGNDSASITLALNALKLQTGCTDIIAYHIGLKKNTNGVRELAIDAAYYLPIGSNNQTHIQPEEVAMDIDRHQIYGNLNNTRVLGSINTAINDQHGYTSCDEMAAKAKKVSIYAPIYKKYFNDILRAATKISLKHKKIKLKT